MLYCTYVREGGGYILSWAELPPADVAIMLSKTAKWLTDGGETGIFTPMYFCVMQKPSL